MLEIANSAVVEASAVGSLGSWPGKLMKFLLTLASVHAFLHCIRNPTYRRDSRKLPTEERPSRHDSPECSMWVAGTQAVAVSFPKQTRKTVSSAGSSPYYSCSIAATAQ